LKFNDRRRRTKTTLLRILGRKEHKLCLKREKKNHTYIYIYAGIYDVYYVYFMIIQLYGCPLVGAPIGPGRLLRPIITNEAIKPVDTVERVVTQFGFLHLWDRFSRRRFVPVRPTDYLGCHTFGKYSIPVCYTRHTHIKIAADESHVSTIISICWRQNLLR